MKLSFVIPAHNEEAYVGKCLNSILKELSSTPHDVEVIVVNNASTDRTKEVALSFPNVKVVDEPHKGLSRARHTGSLATTGDLIANVDSDTMLITGWIEKVMKEFENNKQLVALSGPFIFYDLSAIMNYWVRLFYYLGFVGYLFNRFVFRVGGMLQGGNFVVRKSALEKIGGYNLEYGFGEDADMSRRLYKVGQVKFTFSLPLYASGRRVATEGALTMAWRYGLQYFWTIFFGKPFTQAFPDIRPKQTNNGRLAYKPQNKIQEWSIGIATALILLGVAGGAGFLAYSLSQPGTAEAFTAAHLKMEGKKLAAQVNYLWRLAVSTSTVQR